MQNGTPLGLQVKSVLDAGQLVSDDLVNQLVEDRFKEPDAERGAVLDGFPRNIDQAQALERILGDGGIKLCIYIDLPNELGDAAALVAPGLSRVRHHLRRH